MPCGLPQLYQYQKRTGRCVYVGTINPSLQVDQYPLPKPADLMASLTGGYKFSKLDLSSAYQQMLLEDESSKLVAINTHQGLYEYTRLPFGVASAPAVFQRAMELILQRIPQVICYLDDILVFQRLKDHGVHLKKQKCSFLADSVEYLGHHIDSRGIHTSKKKVQAILNAPAPQNLRQLQSFLGLLNYYAKFIPNLSSMLHPLHALLCTDRRWHWSTECQDVSQAVPEQSPSAGSL